MNINLAIDNFCPNCCSVIHHQNGSQLGIGGYLLNVDSKGINRFLNITPNTIFRTASIIKLIASSLLIYHRSRNQIKLFGPFGKYMTELSVNVTNVYIL